MEIRTLILNKFLYGSLLPRNSIFGIALQNSGPGASYFGEVNVHIPVYPNQFHRGHSTGMGCIVCKQDDTIVIDEETVKNTRANRISISENQIFSAGEVQYDHPIAILDLKTMCEININQRRRPSIQFIDADQAPRNQISDIVEPFQRDHAVADLDRIKTTDGPSLQRKRRPSVGFVDGTPPKGGNSGDTIWPKDGRIAQETISALSHTFSCMTVKCNLYREICTTDPTVQVKSSLGASIIPRQETEGNVRRRVQPLPATILQSFAKASLHL